MVSRGDVIADVGTDHARLPIGLIKAGIVPRAVAIDRHARPIEGARLNITRAGVGDRVSLRLGDGLRPLSREDGVSTVVIAGMGGHEIGRILTEGAPRALGIERLILQPNRDLFALRQQLFTSGWSLFDEALIEQRGRRYVILGVDLLTPPRDYSDVDVLIGPLLRHRAPPQVYRRHLLACRGDLEQRREGLLSARALDEALLKENERRLSAIAHELSA